MECLLRIGLTVCLCLGPYGSPRGWMFSYERGAPVLARNPCSFSKTEFSLAPRGGEREFFIDNLLIQIHLIINMILVDRPCAMGL